MFNMKKVKQLRNSLSYVQTYNSDLIGMIREFIELSKPKWAESERLYRQGKTNWPGLFTDLIESLKKERNKNLEVAAKEKLATELLLIIEARLREQGKIKDGNWVVGDKMPEPPSGSKTSFDYLKNFDYSKENS